MEKVDFVLVGSEAVVESGGLINAVGSNQIAIIAKAANKPFYALAERHGEPNSALATSELTTLPLATNFTDSFHYHSMTYQVTIAGYFRFPVLFNLHPFPLRPRD
jgi:hypothetical protein